jgi:hypothetical protein
MLALTIAIASATPEPQVTHIPPPEMVSPGFAGFLTIFLLAVATILLIRSMVKHLRKVRYSPDPSAEPPARTPPERGEDRR